MTGSSFPPNVVEHSCWCGADRAREIGRFEDSANRGGRSLLRCEGCGTVILHPQPTEAELNQHYSADYYGSSRQKFIWPISRLVEWFQGGRARLAARHAPPGGRILDVGCGNGGFLIQMKRRGFVVEGTEWSAASAARIPADERIPVHVGDLLALDLTVHSYDLITLWHVFEHLRKPHETLRRVRQLLKPGGSLLMSMPNAESRQAERFGVYWFHHDPPRHLFGFGPRSLGRLLDQAGFEVLSSTTWSLEQNPFGFIQSWLNSRGRPRDRLYASLKGLEPETTRSGGNDKLWMLGLLAPAMVISSIEAIAGQGATMAVLARASETAGGPR